MNGMQAPARRRRWPWLVAVAVAVIVIAAVVAVAVAATRNDSKAVSTTTRSSGSTASTPTTNPTPTTAPSATTAPAPADPAIAVWPYVASTTRYADPVAAARGFAVHYVGFKHPLLGAFRPGDAHSGEVDVRTRTGGPVTTVSVRQIGPDDLWWVLGAATTNIQLHAPAAQSIVSSPVRLQGKSSAFEANVQTEIRQDGAIEPLGSGYVMGGGTELGPFDGLLAFSPPHALSGAIMLFTVSMENGDVSEATVERVRFATVPGQ